MKLESRRLLLLISIVSIIYLCYMQYSRIGYIERFKLKQILQFTKSNVELVVAAYGEDLNWIDKNNLKNIATIYQKKKESMNSNHILLPNIGRESHTFLHHIVNNYNKLANITVFVQGSEPTYGYRLKKRDGGHLYCPLTIYDYLLSKEGLFIFTELTSLNNGRIIFRKGYNEHSTCLSKLKENKYSITPLSIPNQCFSLEDYENTIDFINWNVAMTLECLKAQDTSYPYPCSKIKFWKKYIKLPLPPLNFVYYSQGAIFAATKEQIQRRPLDDYKLLLDDFNNSTKPYLGYYMEWMWYPLVTSKNNFCDNDMYYNRKSQKSVNFDKMSNYLECNECGIFNESQYKYHVDNNYLH